MKYKRINFKQNLETITYPAVINLFQVNNENTSTMFEIYSELTKKTPERRQRCCSDVFIVNFEQISRIVCPLLTLNNEMTTGK